jgi:hypothetical protein
MREAVVDGRPGPAPAGLFIELATFGAGALLLFFHPGTGAIVLDWWRLLGLAVPVFLALLALERRLSRAIRARTVGTYPTVWPVLLVLFGLAIALVGTINRAFPTSSRWVHVQVQGWFPRERPTGDLLAAPPPQASYAGPNAWLAAVDSWRDPSEVFHLPVEEEDLRAASAAPHAELDVRLVRGILGVEQVAQVRLARDR